MPKTIKPLTKTTINNLKPKKSRYPKADGGCTGLFIEVMPSGSKIWRFRYTLHGKRKPPVTIGNYPEVDITEARQRGRKYSGLVARGVSPVDDAKQDRGASVALDSIRSLSDVWYQTQIADKSESYSSATRRILDKDVLPYIGDKSVTEINAGDVLAICERVKARGAPQAALLTRNVIKRMYDYAIAKQLVQINPARMLVARYVAEPNSRDRVLSPDEIGRVMRAIYKSDSTQINKYALHLLCITMVRKSELINAEWQEIDFDSAIWRIPPERMKTNKEHWVYLSRQALAMFTELKEHALSPVYVFPARNGSKDRPMSKSTLNQAVKALDMDVQHFVLHDFRRTASTHLHEMGMSSDAIEKALAHTIKGIKGVYNRAQYAEERKQLLQFWADFVEDQIQGGKVIIGNFSNSLHESGAA